MLLIYKGEFVIPRVCLFLEFISIKCQPFLQKFDLTSLVGDRSLNIILFILRPISCLLLLNCIDNVNFYQCQSFKTKIFSNLRISSLLIRTKSYEY